MIPELLPVALEFYRDPRRHPHLRDPRQPLPVGVTELLAASRGVLGRDQINHTAAQLSSSPDELFEALRFFAKEAMLRAGGDCFRTLGLSPDSSPALVRQHYRHLISLFHPDKDTSGEGWDSLYAPAINAAYAEARGGAKQPFVAPVETQPPPAVAPNFQGTERKPPRTVQPTRRSFWRSPWPYAIAFGLVVAVLISLFAGRDRAPTMVMRGPEAVRPEPVSPQRLEPVTISAERRIPAVPVVAVVLEPVTVSARRRASVTPAQGYPLEPIDVTAEPRTSVAPTVEFVLEPVRVAARRREPVASALVSALEPITVTAVRRAPLEPIFDDDIAVARLMSGYSEAYVAGDPRALSQLFTVDAVTTEASGRPAITALYERFFRDYRADAYRFLHLNWARTAPGAFRVDAEVAIDIRARGSNASDSVELDLEVELTRRDDQLLISRMAY